MALAMRMTRICPLLYNRLGTRMSTPTLSTISKSPVNIRLFTSIWGKQPLASTLTPRHDGPIKIFVRTVTDIPKFSSQKTLLKLRMQDGVPKNYELIYRTTFGNYLLSVQVLHFLILGSVLTMIAIKGLEIMFPGTEDEIAARVAWAKENQVIPVMETEEQMIARLRNPTFDQVAEGGLPIILFLVVALAFAIGGVNRFQRCLPIRMYTSPKGHSIAIFYGHIIPLRTTRYEFMAGNLKLQTNPKNKFFSMSNYKDITGKDLILMEHFFRYPVDLSRLQGIETDDGKWTEDDHRSLPEIPDDDPSLTKNNPDTKPRKYK